MTTPEQDSDEAAAIPVNISPKKRHRLVLALKLVAITLGIWLVAAYLILPLIWKHYEHQPKLANAPKTTLTAQGIPGDPLNVGLIGQEADVVGAMLAAGWNPADPITLVSSLKIAGSVVFRHPDPRAPVSNLFLFGRKQDLAFEKAAGTSARKRHHVRFWKSVDLGTRDTPLFIGSATFDVSVGLSHLTGEVTHHISPEIDAQRDSLIADLTRAGKLAEIYQVTGVGATLIGRNGGGDRYFTDGELTIGAIGEGIDGKGTPTILPNPTVVDLKNQLWDAITPLLSSPES